MNSLIRCDSCHGTKKIMGMGGIQTPCPYCKALGWIETNEVSAVKIDNLKNLNGNPVKAKKKPGPKPRVQKDMFVNIE